jgi:hypothetical protein
MHNLFEKLFEGSKQETKLCNQCLKVLPIGLFSFNSGASHRRSKCKKCDNVQKQQRNKFRLFTPPPNHVCPICNRTEFEVQGKGGGKSGAWCLDHNHLTGEYRGFLCHECNRALGNFKDSISLLESAIKYLKASKA